MLTWTQSAILLLETLVVGVLLVAVMLGLLDMYIILLEVFGHADKKH